jgi:quinol monooxygenase YgiN
MIHVIATIEIKDGKKTEYLDALHANVPNVRAEDGCHLYVPCEDAHTDIAAQPPLRPHVVTVVEHWESMEALKKHLDTAHMKAFREKVQDLVQGTSLHILQEL